MAQPIACDICQAEEAIQMLTNLHDGTVLAVGAMCLPAFYGHSVLTVMQAGVHKGPAGKCQACRRVHERMTTPVAPAGTRHDDAVPGATAEAPPAVDTGALTDENPVTGDMETYPADSDAGVQ